MMALWKQICKLECQTACFSLLSPFHDNLEIYLGLSGGFSEWKNKHIHTIRDVVDNGKVLTFDQMINKFDIHRKYFFQVLPNSKL